MTIFEKNMIMKTKNNKQTRDYEKERKDLFENALKKIDPRIQKTIELIEKINGSENQIKYETTTSYSGTMI